MPFDIVAPPIIGPIDVGLGKRIRSERRARGLSAKALAKTANMTPEKLQMAEVGVLRFSATDLMHLLRALDRDPPWLFAEIKALQ